MYDRAAILRSAWAMYRDWFTGRNRPFKFNRSDFSVYLAAAWRMAKETAMSAPAVRSERIREEIARLPYKAARVNVDAVRARLSDELAALAA